MSVKPYDIDHKVPSFYGEEDYTFRDAIEQGKCKVYKEVSLDTNYKPQYFVNMGFFKIRINGNQAKKYLQKGEE